MVQLLLDLGVILILLLGIAQFRSPRQARAGNLTAALAMACALIIVLLRHGLGALPLVLGAALVGSVAGWVVAIRAHMIQIPAMVAFQHGMGGVAAFLISFIELSGFHGSPLAPAAEASALLGLMVGGATFSGSMVAAGKLADRLRQMPMVLPAHNLLLGANAVSMGLLLIAVETASDPGAARLSAFGLILVSAGFGVLFAMRVGGADMPVLISFLNATAGLAAAFCGIAVGSRLLVASGATVAASGSILTHVMCRAMNRSLASIFAGISGEHLAAMPPISHTLENETIPGPAEPLPQNPDPSASADPLARAVAALQAARRVIIIPGYGMALADASEEVVRLAETLAADGREVLFAVHPVAGRMPGHMHVLLAEAEADYGMIRELKDVDSEFARTDVAVVVGACDVVNPAAMQTDGTPISGMPILRAHEAANVIVCNLDRRPGYSGVDNPLYRDPRTILLLGDAKPTLAQLLREISA